MQKVSQCYANVMQMCECHASAMQMIYEYYEEAMQMWCYGYANAMAMQMLMQCKCYEHAMQVLCINSYPLQEP